MKKISVVIIFLLIVGKISAGNSLAGAYRGIMGAEEVFLAFFNDNQIRLSTISTVTIGETGERISINDVKEGSYFISNNYGISFITFLWDNKAWDKYLVLTGADMCLLYQSDGEPCFKGFYWGEDEEAGGWTRWGPMKHFYHSTPYHQITASSSLREGSRIYSPENINDKIGEAWSEGVSGQGIGEYLTVSMYLGENDDFYISIGYVSYLKPNLYTENSRPKRLRLTYDNEHFSYVDLKDTADFQSIALQAIPLGNGHNYREALSLKIEILEVYPGTKYTDTCINAILAEEAIP
jgi:hypothetical protein